jgi:tetratricopeptide (TPR) repeat protein/CHAT domain-containing protein
MNARRTASIILSFALALAAGAAGSASAPAPDTAPRSAPAAMPASATERMETYAAGAALLDAGENERAARFFEEALAKSGALVELAEGLVEARSRLCAPNAAVARCGQAMLATQGARREVFEPYLDGERSRLRRDFNPAATRYLDALSAAVRNHDTLSTVVCGKALALCLVASRDARGVLETARLLDSRESWLPRAGRLAVSVMSARAECLNATDSVEAADSLYREALSLAKAGSFRQIESACLAGLGRLDEKRQSFGGAILFYRQALALERAMGSREKTATLLDDLGQVEASAGDFETAAGRFAEAEEIAKACGLKWILGYVLYGRGTLAEKKGDTEGALKLFQQALALHADQGDVRGEPAVQFRLGYLRGSLGQYTLAVAHYERALKVYEETANLSGLSSTLAGLAVAYHKLGDFAKAEEYYQRTLDVKRRLDDKRGAAWSLNSLGMIADMQGRYRDALSFEHEAMAMYREAGDRAGTGEAHFSIGSVYYDLGNYTEALKHYEEAFAVAVETGNGQFLGTVASGMGSVYSAAGRLDLAGEPYRKCLEIARASKQKTAVAGALDNLASLEIRLGDFAGARAHAGEALALLPAEGQDYIRARALYVMGTAGGPAESSIGYLERALALAEGGGIEELKWKCLSDLGELYLAKGDTAKSYSLQHRAIVSVESLRRLAGSDELRRHFFQPAILPYERIVSVILTRSGRAPDVKEAFSYTERCRAQILASLLREAMERTGAKGNDRLLGREREILSRLAFYQARLQDGTITPVERAGLLEKIEGLERRFTSLSLKLEQRDKDYLSELYPKVEQPDELFSSLAPDETALSYFLGEKRSYVFCGKKGELAVYELPAKAFIEQRVDRFLSLLQQMANASEGTASDPAATDTAATGPAIPAQVFDLASNELYDLLLEPAAGSLEAGEKLIVVPDGLLNRLPFALLKSGNRHLVEDHDVSYAPSLRTLRYLRERNAVRARSSHAPEYDVIAIGASGESATGSKGGARVYPFTDIPIEPLPRAAQEAKDVASVFSRSLVLAGRSAGEGALRESRIDDTGILHFAARAYIDNDDPRRSFVVLNPERGFGDTLARLPEDGLLQWHEIAALKLNAALVTLSACRSTGGVLSYGEGISGLTQAFLYAGGGCVLAAQLDIPDDLAGEMTIEYYRNVKKGLGASAALSAAQRTAIAKGGAIANPAVWGAFAAIGDGASAPRLARGIIGSRFIGLALVCAAAVLAALAIRRRRRD